MSEHPLTGTWHPEGYHLVREIGRGAVGVVFEARAADGAVAAVKVLPPPPLLEGAEAHARRSRFLREARALSAVDHPNVVRIFDAGEGEGHLYLAMEFLDGENLRQLLTRTGPLAPDAAVALVLQLCHALDAVHHAGIVHRDVKPENVVVLRDGTVKLTDFGIAWMDDEATLTRTGGVLGSPAYMSPEQILGRPVDRRSDLFAAAVSLYQLLSDRLPFEGKSLMEMAHNVAYSEPAPLPPSVPHALARATLRGLQKSPAARYATATEFAAALRPPVPAPPRPLPDLAPGPAAVLPADAPTATVVDAGSRCSRHPARPAAGLCQACRRPLCRACVRGDRPPYFCRIHTPVTIFGISAVRLEVALALAAFLLLLLCLSPVGYAALWR